MQNTPETENTGNLSFQESLGQLGVVLDDINDGVEVVDCDDEQDESMNTKSTVDSISECFFDFFQDSAFDLDRFVTLSDIFFESERFSTMTDHSIDKIKSKVITRLLIKMFVSAGLSKSQIDTMNKLVKATIVLVSRKKS